MREQDSSIETVVRVTGDQAEGGKTGDRQFPSNTEPEELSWNSDQRNESCGDQEVLRSRSKVGERVF